MEVTSSNRPQPIVRTHARFHLLSLIQLFKEKASLSLPPAEWLDSMRIGISACEVQLHSPRLTVFRDGELLALAHDRYLALVLRANAEQPVKHIIDAKCREGYAFHLLLNLAV